MFVIVLGSDGTPLSAGGEIEGRIPDIPANLLAAASASGEAAATIEPAPDVRLRVHVRPWSRPDLGFEGHVVAAQSTRRVENELRAGRAFVIALAIFAFLIAAGAVWLVIGRALRPLKQLAALTDEVGRTQVLGRRLPVPPAQDEMRRLSESFNDMMAPLDAAHRQLTEALDSQKRFVADASHELRTPLTTIRSNAGFLIERPGAASEDREAALRDIAAESERMGRLIQDLLTLARADAGHRLEKAPLDLTSIVQDVTRQARNLHPAREIRLEAEALSITGNADALKQFLWILVDNAVRHTSDGGRLRIALEEHDSWARVLVADDGEGIPEAHLPHIFERFYQADAARSGGGAGLGLSIARWMVEDHGGRISAYNNDHGGATFLVELPLAGAAAEPEVSTRAEMQAAEAASDVPVPMPSGPATG